MGRLVRAVRRRLSVARETVELHRCWKNGKGYCPQTVELLVTAPCDCRCVFCNVWHPAQPWRRAGGKKELSLEQYVHLFDELAALGTKSVFFSGGEPFLRRDIIPLLRQAKQHAFQILINTNGGALNQRLAVDIVDVGVDTIVFSIDAPKPDVHDKLRGTPGLWEKAIANMARVRAARQERGSKKPVIGVSYAVSRMTVGLIRQMLEAKGQMGYDVISFQPLVPKTSRAEELLCTREDIERLRTEVPLLRKVGRRVGVPDNTFVTGMLGGMFIDPSEASRGRYASLINRNTLCFTPWLLTDIDPFGVVYPCCYADTYQNLNDDGSGPFWGNADYSMGDLTKQKFAEIWNGPRYVEFRRRCQQPPSFPMCAWCGYQVCSRQRNGRLTELFVSGSFARRALVAAGRATWRDVRRLAGKAKDDGNAIL